MGEDLRVLILEDVVFDAELEEFELQEAGIHFTSKLVMTEDEYRRGLLEFSPNVILSDYDLPQYNGALALAEAKKLCPDTPFILVTGAVGEDRAIEILTQGAKDYVMKNRLSRLAPAVQRALSEAEALKARKKAEEELQQAHKVLENQVEQRTAELQIEIAVRKQAEESLRRSEEKLRLALDASGQGTWDWNLLDGELIWSDKCKSLYGLERDAAINYTAFLNLIHPEDRERIQSTISQSLDNKDDYDVEMRVVWPDGGVRWLASKGRGLYDSVGNPVRMIGVTHDITERRRLEDDLMKARKLETVGTLAGEIAHDFNNLLAAIQGNVELIKLILPHDNPAQKKLQAVDAAIRQSVELTKRLITFARGGEPIKKLCDIREMIRDTVSRTLTALPLEQRYCLDDDLWQVEIDEGQMQQVIRNLALNGAEAMPEEGILTIKTNNIIVNRTDHLPIPEGPYIRISVVDTGHGISGSDLPHIFDPYYSTKQRGPQKGMGLGLSVCHSIVGRHNGCIAVNSLAGKGSTFDVYIPVFSRKEQAEPVLPNKKISEPSHKKRILVMDDEAMVREVTGQLLTVMGYDVETAPDGARAIELYTEAKAAGNAFDMVFLDMTVKGGLGGVPTMERLLEIDPEVRAIILSGYSDDRVIHNFRQYGFIGTITKPFTTDRLTNIMERLT
ncbi:MAG: response regulator [Syntrophales bacterium]|nr:response regulator [Syntrophales bacterium]